MALLNVHNAARPGLTQKRAVERIVRRKIDGPAVQLRSPTALSVEGKIACIPQATVLQHAAIKTNGLP
mgnify:CR=1 FL=1